MKIFLHLILVISWIVIGFIAGAYTGGHYLMPVDSGLAAGAMGIGYGVLGAVLLGGIVIVLIPKVSLRALQISAVFSFLTAAVLMVFISVQMKNNQRNPEDPDHEYAGLPVFMLTLTQIKIADPYLITNTELDGMQRSWATTLPDGRVCRGQMRSQGQKEISAALQTFVQLTKKDLAPCLETEAQAERLLVWDLPESKDINARGQLKISPACLIDQPIVAKVVEKTLLANRSPTGPVKCR
ncbi:MAG: hypothetical protein KC733_06060 [Candidatus Omnitrophica bacterium]|nr:hypothetical protein [Candidatus Omnitrophota bacterium]